MRIKYASLTLAMTLAVAGIAHGQGGQEGEFPAIADWNYEDLYEQGGIRAENLLGAEVIGVNGEEIGEVENAVFNADNQMVGVIAEVGGFWDIADRHVAVPFEQVEFTDDGVAIPVTERNVDEFELFGNNEFVPASAFEPDRGQRGGNWRLTAVVDDYAALGDGTRFGYVDDVLIRENGEIQAAVVEASQALEGETYAYPFNAYAGDWQPGQTAWRLPYPEQEATGLEPFNYDQYETLLGS